MGFSRWSITCIYLRMPRSVQLAFAWVVIFGAGHINNSYAQSPPVSVNLSLGVNAVSVRFSSASACNGFDPSTTPPFLMAPFSPATNATDAVIKPASRATAVLFSSEDDTIATISPARATGTPQTLTTFGLLHLDTYVLAHTEGSSTKRVLGLSAKDIIAYKVAIHAITQNNDDVQVTPVGSVGAVCVTAGATGRLHEMPTGDDVVSGTNILSGSDGICQTTVLAQLVPSDVPTNAALETYLNQVFKKQANVAFTVTRTDPSPIDFDLNNDGALADPVVPGSGIPSPEMDAISTRAASASVDFNVYFVKKMALPAATTLRSFGESFIGDLHSGESAVNVAAHEIGHQLGLRDTAATSDYYSDLMYPSTGNPVANPCNLRKTEWDSINP